MARYNNPSRGGGGARGTNEKTAHVFVVKKKMLEIYS